MDLVEGYEVRLNIAGPLGNHIRYTAYAATPEAAIEAMRKIIAIKGLPHGLEGACAAEPTTFGIADALPLVT